MTSLLDDDTPPQRRQSDQPSIMKVLSVTLGALTIGSLIFTAGYNWRGVDALEKNQDQFVRKDVQSEQLQLMRQSIDELRRNQSTNSDETKRQFDELRAEIRRRKE